MDGPAGDPQPQRRDRAAPVQEGPAAGQLRMGAAPRSPTPSARPRGADQVRHHAGAGRDDGRGQGGDARPARVGRGHPDHRPVSAAHPRSTCPSSATTRPDEFAELKDFGARRSASGGWRAGRWCAPPITPSSRCGRSRLFIVSSTENAGRRERPFRSGFLSGGASPYCSPITTASVNTQGPMIMPPASWPATVRASSSVISCGPATSLNWM